MTTNQNEKLGPSDPSTVVFEITTGLLLGDGNLQKPIQCKNYRLRFTQNQKRQDYVEWLIEQYSLGLDPLKYKKPLVASKIPHRYQYKTVLHKLEEVSFSFQTRISSAFDTHAQIFYHNKSTKKNLCNDLSCFETLLTPRALAHWYMDDGSWPNKQSLGFILCTHGYKLNAVVYFSELLNKKFDLITKVRLNKKQPIISISAKCYPIFCKLISPYLKDIPSMKAKFPIKLIET